MVEKSKNQPLIYHHNLCSTLSYYLFIPCTSQSEGKYWKIHT